MGIHTSAVLLYGIPVPDDHRFRAYHNEKLLDVVLRRHPGVNHASAGLYDRDIRYLCTDFYEAEISRFVGDHAMKLSIAWDERSTAERNARLEYAAMDLKILNHPDPAWYLIANQD